MPQKMASNGAAKPASGGGITSSQNGHLAETGRRCSACVKVIPFIKAMIEERTGEGKWIESNSLYMRRTSAELFTELKEKTGKG